MNWDTDAVFAGGKYDLVILYVSFSNISGNPTILCTEEIYRCLTDEPDTLSLSLNAAGSDLHTIRSEMKANGFCR